MAFMSFVPTYFAIKVEHIFIAFQAPKHLLLDKAFFAEKVFIAHTVVTTFRESIFRANTSGNGITDSGVFFPLEPQQMHFQFVGFAILFTALLDYTEHITIAIL